MANTITLFDKIVSMLDEVYKTASCTAILDGSASLAQPGANAHEIKIPKLDMDGLGTCSRTSGYVDGAITATLETVEFNYERGRKFSVDTMDDEEFGGLILANLASEFMRTKIVPELDAFRFSTYCGVSGIGALTPETFTTGKDVLEALNTVYADMTEDEVPETDRHLFITPTLYKLANAVDNTVNKDILTMFASLNQVPQARFYTGITLKDGKTEGQTAGGFAKATEAADLNFLVVHKPASMQYEKRSIGQPIAPESNPDADATVYKFREYGLCDAYENKAAGIYKSAKAASQS
jgi:hypothetical protein